MVFRDRLRLDIISKEVIVTTYKLVNPSLDVDTLQCIPCKYTRNINLPYGLKLSVILTEF